MAICHSQWNSKKKNEEIGNYNYAFYLVMKWANFRIGQSFFCFFKDLPYNMIQLNKRTKIEDESLLQLPQYIQCVNHPMPCLPSTVCWFEVKVVVFVHTSKYKHWNPLVIKVLHIFWYVKHQIRGCFFYILNSSILVHTNFDLPYAHAHHYNQLLIWNSNCFTIQTVGYNSTCKNHNKQILKQCYLNFN